MTFRPLRGHFHTLENDLGEVETSWFFIANLENFYTLENDLGEVETLWFFIANIYLKIDF